MPLTYLAVYAVCFFASTIGAICGIGGGVIIKPVLDAFGLFPVSIINFLSGCTVLSMTVYSVIRSRVSGASTIDLKVGTPLAVGAAVGGIAGKQLFEFVASLFPNPNTAGAFQAVTLGIITVGTLVYTLFKSRIPTRHVEGTAPALIIGCLLGIMSSFLGIGGGPINLVVLFYFYSMETKEAAQNSLYIIMFSQAASTILSLATTDLASVSILIVAGMVLCGILGGIVGRAVHSRIESHHVDKLFIGLMAVIICICVYNAAKYVL